ncbi:hypothetical protein CWR48_06220 [Oceanobacillus arenosus]|uniref:Uncharacterized protein n=1 Tax=Oceanobacillus arenosus TaxID=1229153 RepID=A0A3D8PWX8_9BACI|nr:hypothetical protein [Oceanobacillus arenosus]RDW20282.1 hypothetical protein CWR48_06220 [Oceanobacillus arenosus]
MIRSKTALISSAIILCICMYLCFPFPNNVMLDVRSAFMSFPIRNRDGYIMHGIIGSILFIIAMILLAIGLKKYHIRTLLIVAIVYALTPQFLIKVYQETLASGITAISYNGDGNCQFETVSKDLLNGECNFILHNHSNEDVSFELEFLDSDFGDEEVQMESLMNLADSYPFRITLEANSQKPIHIKEVLELSDVPKHIDGGTSFDIHFKLIDGEISRTL